MKWKTFWKTFAVSVASGTTLTVLDLVANGTTDPQHLKTQAIATAAITAAAYLRKSPIERDNAKRPKAQDRPATPPGK